MLLHIVARGKIVEAAKRNEKIPEGWALDSEGRPTTDAGDAERGVVLPMSGAKGSGLAIMVEVLAGVLAGGRFAGDAFEAHFAPNLGGHLAVAYHDDSADLIGDVGVVGDYKHGGPQRLVDPAEQVQYFRRRGVVQLAGRLVGQQQRRRVGQGYRDGHPLLLAPGQLLGRVMQPVTESDQLQQLLCALLPEAPRGVCEHHGQGHVLDGCEIRKHISAGLLPYEPDLVTTVLLYFPATHLEQVPATDADFAGGRGIVPGQDVQQGALAAAAGAHYGNHLAALDGQVEPPEGHHLKVSYLVYLEQVLTQNVSTIVCLCHSVPRGSTYQRRDDRLSSGSPYSILHLSQTKDPLKRDPAYEP